MTSKSQFKMLRAKSPLSAGHGAFTSADFEEFDSNMYLSGGHPDRCHIYPVSGDSCVPDIPHGSLVSVDPFIQPLNGHIVAAEVDGLNHIKIFERKESHLRLVSPNGDYDPIEIRERDNYHHLGVVIGCAWRVTRVFQVHDTPEPVYSLKGFQTEGTGFRAKFDSSDGRKLDIAIDRQSMKDGIMWATKALGKKVLHWRTNSDE